MKSKFLVRFLAKVVVICAMLAPSLQAATVNEQIQKDTESLAIFKIVDSIKSGVESYTGSFLGIGDWIAAKIAEIREVSDALVEMYDENGNGRIDPGSEWDNLRAALIELSKNYLDSIGNSDGKLDTSDIDGIFLYFVNTLEDFAVKQLCQYDLLAMAGIYTPWYNQNCR